MCSFATTKRIWSLLVAGLVSLSGAAAGGAPDRLTVCVDRPRADRPHLRLLQTWLPSLSVAVVSRADCRASHGRYRGWFERRGGRVEFVLTSRMGVRSRRRLPWLLGRMSLAGLAARGKLGRFAVILEGLVIERELSWLLDDPPARKRRPGARPPEEQIIASHRERSEQPGHRRRRRRPPGLLAETLVSLDRTERRPEKPRPQPARKPGSAQPAAHPITAATTLGFVGPGPSSHPASQLPAASRPVSPDTAPALWPKTRRPRARTKSTVTAAAGRSAVQQRETPAIRSSSEPQRHTSSFTRHLGAEAHFAGRWRSGGVLAPEMGGWLGWRGLYLGAGYQSAAEWDLGGRRVEVTAVPIWAGWRPVLLSRRSLELRADLALNVEHLMLRRIDLQDRSVHGHWDVGIGGGLTAGFRFRSGLGLGLGVAALWFPAGQEIQIEDGPSAQLSTFGVRWAFLVDWQRIDEDEIEARAKARPSRSPLEDLLVAAHVAERWRSGGLLATEVGGRLGWRGLFVGAGYQPPARWDQLGIPIEVTAIPLAAGWRPVVWRRKALELQAEAALLVERLAFQQGSDDYSAWEVGVSGGAMLGYRFRWGLGFGIGASLSWFPAAREIQAGGQSSRLSHLGVKWDVFVDWRDAR